MDYKTGNLVPLADLFRGYFRNIDFRRIRTWIRCQSVHLRAVLKEGQDEKKSWQNCLCCGFPGSLLYSVFTSFRNLPGQDLQRVRYGPHVYDIEEDTLDVLCLGSSHAYYGFQPNVLWNEYGITSCVLGSPQQTAALSYYLLKEALQYQKPEVVLFESYYLWFDQLYTKEERLRQAMDPMRFGTVKMEMVDELLGDLSWKEKFNYYVPFMTYHQRWQELENSDFHSKPYLKGSFMRAHVHSMEDLGVAREAVEIPETSLEYLNKW